MLQHRVGTSTTTLSSASGYRCTTLPTVNGAPTSAISAKLRPNDASAEYVDAIQCATNPELKKPTNSNAKYAAAIAAAAGAVNISGSTPRRQPNVVVPM